MFLLGLQAHQINYVDQPHLERGQALAKDVRCGQCLQGGYIAAAAEHDVGVAAAIT